MIFVNLRHRAVAMIATSFAAIAVPPSAWAQAPDEGFDEPRRTRSGDIIVTGQSHGDEAGWTLPATVLAGDELVHRRQGGLGETLAGLPGIHLDSFGGGASRPVIRGQTVPRIEILSDGANIFDASSVSPDHAIAADPLLLDGIEILQGPAAVRYGGNALGGAVNLIDSKVPKARPSGGLSGATEVRFGTGDEEKTMVGRITAGAGSFALHAEGSRHVAEDYNVPEGFGSTSLRDSFARGSSYAVGVSWVGSNGYLGAAYSRQDSLYGLPGHSHANAVCHIHGLDLHCAAHGNASDPLVGSDDGHSARIDLRNERIDVRGDYDRLFPGIDHARLRLSHTLYAHDEIDGDLLFSQYRNEVLDGRLELSHASMLGFAGTLGVQVTDGTFSGLNFNEAHRGFKPGAFHSRNLGLFLSERRSFGALDIEVGGRWDRRRSRADFPSFQDAIGLSPGELAGFDPSIQDLLQQIYRDQFVIPEARHNLLSLSAGARWTMQNGVSLAISLARTERAPSVRELYASGNNLATNSFEIGLLRSSQIGEAFPNKRSNVREVAQSVDVTLRKNEGRLQFEFGMFLRDYDDYIFARLLASENETGITHRYLLYATSDARFLGLDGHLSYQLDDASRVTLFGDLVDARLRNENDNLPRTPPGRLGARYELRAGRLSFEGEYHHTFAQNRVASYETPTAGYHMVNATLAYRFDLGSGKGVELYARGTNLANELAFVHSSFAKDQSPLRGRSIAIGMRHIF